MREADLRRLADLYVASSPALVKCGWGLERNRNGGSAAAAVLALPAVAGKFGVRGGGYSMSNSASWDIERRWLGDAEPATRAVNMNKVGRILTEPEGAPVNVLFVYNCNPVVTLPDQHRVIRGLEREDLFTVVFDQVLTDTALYADVVLPATTFLEHYDFARGYGPITLQLGKPVIDAVGESRSNADVFMDLVRRLDLAVDGDPEDDLEAMLSVLGGLPEAVGNACATPGRPTRPTADGPCSSWTCSRRRRIRRSTCSRRRSTPRRHGPLRVPGRPGHRGVSARADLARQRSDHQLDAGRTVTTRREAGDAPR